MTLQSEAQALNDSILNQRFQAQIVAISDDILGEPTTVDHHYLRVLTVKKSLYDLRAKQSIARGFLNKAIAQSSLTLPTNVDGSGNQDQPTDTEIVNAVNGYMATPAVLEEVLNEALSG